MTPISRRRFLTISAASAAVPAFAHTPADARWSGTALGARASMRFAGLRPREAAPVIAAVERELSRLEQIFSLYRPTSQLSRLNQTGVLPDPAPELLQVLSLCSALHHASSGVFDPSVQPLWVAMAQQSNREDLWAARARVGWQHVQFDRHQIRFGEHAPHGMALTLNGIAQGAITDRIAGLLRDQGLKDVLVDMGEIAALGNRSDGTAWQVGIANPAGDVLRRVTLKDRAVASSASAGTLLNPDSGQGHILNPLDPDAKPRSMVSVAADSAAVADGLSTALCLLPDQQAQDVLQQFSQVNPEQLI